MKLSSMLCFLAILAICCGIAAAQAPKVQPTPESKLDPYHVVVEETDPKKEDYGLSVKPEKPKLSASIEVLPYDLVGGPITFHGDAFVDKSSNENSFTIGEVSKGPPPIGGLFEGYYLLTKAKPNAYFFDNPLNPRKALQVRLGLSKDGGVVVYRTGYKRLFFPGWVWSDWSDPLVAW